MCLHELEVSVNARMIAVGCEELLVSRPAALMLKEFNSSKLLHMVLLALINEQT